VQEVGSEAGDLVPTSALSPPAATANITPAFEAAAIAESSAALFEPPIGKAAVAFPTRFLCLISWTVQLTPEITIEPTKFSALVALNDDRRWVFLTAA
jgi:hypothetical protein